MSDEKNCLRKRGLYNEAYQELPPPYPGTPTAYPCTPTQVTVNGHSPIILQLILHEDPVSVTCPYCQANIVTSIRYKNGKATWLASGIMCFFGLYLGCCLLPFLIKDCKDVVHSCPNCRTEIGRYKRFQKL